MTFGSNDDGSVEEKDDDDELAAAAAALQFKLEDVLERRPQRHVAAAPGRGRPRAALRLRQGARQVARHARGRLFRVDPWGRCDSLSSR